LDLVAGYDTAATVDDAYVTDDARTNLEEHVSPGSHAEVPMSIT
jgi:hypothetical protein